MAAGMALHEETVMDQRLGRFMTHNFAGYHIPVDAVIPEIEVVFVDEPDTSGVQQVMAARRTTAPGTA